VSGASNAPGAPPNSPPPKSSGYDYTHPWGVAHVGNQLVSQQKYDITLELRMPRTRENIEAGNFMLDLSLFAAGASAMNVVTAAAFDKDAVPDVLVRSSRSAILRYRSLVVEAIHRALRLPLYVMGWGAEEDVLKVVMMEGATFEKGWRNLPGSARVEVRGREVLQVYGCSLRFEARLTGLRYIMYNYRIASFLTFTGLFWTVEMGALLCTWALLSLWIFPHTTGFFAHERPAEKEEEDRSQGEKWKQEFVREEPEPSGLPTESENLSDTERSFPTFSRQPPLRYTSPSGIKKEETPAEREDLSNIPLAPGEAADDEDEDADFLLDDGVVRTNRDSGLGTSLESTTERDKRGDVRRRRSAGGKGRDT
jgi:seipin